MSIYRNNPATPKTIEDAVLQNECDALCSTTGNLKDLTIGMNVAPILTKLIQETGRFAENHASDLFILWQSLQKTLADILKNKQPDELAIFTTVFAIRKSGVDEAASLMQNLKRDAEMTGYVHPEYRYRKILALTISIDTDMETIMTLYDITNHIARINPQDKI